MSATNADTLLQGTKQLASITNQAIKTLTPLKTDGIQLAPGSKLDEGKIGQAIAMATGQEVEEVIFIRVTSGTPHDQTDEKLRHELMKLAFPGSTIMAMEDLGNITAALTQKSFQNDLWKNPWFNLWNSIPSGTKMDINTSLSPLWDKLSQELWNSIHRAPHNILMDNLKIQVIAYINLLFTLQAEKAKRMEPLINLLTTCLPLGFRTDNPGAFLVITANEE